MKLSWPKLRYHRTLLKIILVIFVFSALAYYANYLLTYRLLQTHYLQTFESKGWNELSLYHEVIANNTADYFQRNLDVVISLAKEDGLIRPLQLGQSEEAQLILSRQRLVNKNFTVLFALDAAGKLVAASGQDGTADKFIGTSFADRAYYQAILKKKTAHISEIYKGRLGNEVLSFCAPALGSESKVEWIVCGGSRLPTLSELLGKTVRPSVFTAAYPVILDRGGAVLLEKDTTGLPEKRQNIFETDRAARQLFEGKSAVKEEEIDYGGEKALVIGSRLEFGEDNQIYVLSYFPKAAFDSDLASLGQEIKRIYVGNGARDLLLMILLYAAVAQLIKKHDDATSSQ